MNTNKLYEGLSIEEQRQFDADVEAYFKREGAKPKAGIIYLPTAQLDMESIFSPSDDVHHPNFKH